MNSDKFKQSFLIINEKGLHTRPATELVKCAQRFKSKVSLHHQGVEVNAKSVLEILMLAATSGSKIEIEAQGEDAAAAVNAVILLASNKFNIHY